MAEIKLNIRDLLAEARAVHLAMKYGAISYEQAKVRTQPMLMEINRHLRRAARRKKVKYKTIIFQDLGRML